MARAFRLAGVLVVVLLAATAPGNAQDLRGRIRINSTTTEIEQETVNVLDQNYQVSFRMPVTRFFSYLVRARHINTDSQSEIFDLTTTNGRKLTEPLVEVVWQTPTFELATGVRYTVERLQPDGSSDQRDRRTDWYSRLNWTPQKFPSLSVRYDRLRYRNADLTTNDDEQRLFTTLAQSVGPVRWTFNNERRNFTDNSSDYNREQIRNALRVDYRQRFSESRFSLNSSVLLQEQRKVEKARTPVDVENVIDPNLGLFAVDTTPLLDPLPPEPALIDGNTLTPTAVNIGGSASGGGLDRNLGLDFDGATAVDSLWLWLDVPLPLTSVGRYSWALYSSDDNNLWTLVDPSVTLFYNTTFNRFELSFVPIGSRFLKVVNTDFDSTLGPVSVTEMTALITTELLGENRRTDDTRSLSLGLNWSPTPHWSFGSSTFGAADRTDDDRGRFEEKRLDQSFSALWRPTPKISGNALVRWRIRNRDLNPDERDFSWTVGMGASPYETLDLGLAYSHRNETEDGLDDLEVKGWQGRMSAQLLTDLNLTVDLGYSNTFDYERALRTRQRTLRMLLFTRPRRNLAFLSDLVVDHLTFTGPAVVTDESNQRIWSNRVSYQPTPMVNLVAEIRFESTPIGSGVANRINVDWLPFPGGALVFSLSYLNNAQAIVGGKRDQLRAQLRWTVRQGIILEATYFRDTRDDNGFSTVSNTLGFLLEIRF